MIRGDPVGAAGELCRHIKVTPPLGPHKGGQPATEDAVGKPLEFIGRVMKRVTNYRLVLSDENVYSIIIQG